MLYPSSANPGLTFACNAIDIDPHYALQIFRKFVAELEEKEGTTTMRSASKPTYEDNNMDNAQPINDGFSPQPNFSLEEKAVISVLPGSLRENFKKMLPFMADDEVRPHLCGIYCEYANDTITMCATNGHIFARLSWRQRSWNMAIFL